MMLDKAMTSVADRPPPKSAVVLVSNGPGELSTWVRPLALRLQRSWLPRSSSRFASRSLQLVLVPCPNGTGREHQVAESWDLFDRIVPARLFWRLLLWPGRYGPWPRQGVVVFLGGDQFWTVLLSARLGYRHLTYAEWVARWPRWNDRIALMGAQAERALAPRWRSRARVVGDLMADLSEEARTVMPLPPGPWLALLPGSKRAKLRVGVPFLLEVADRLAQLSPTCRCLLPLAPTVTAEELVAYAGPCNRIARFYKSGVPRLVASDVLVPGRQALLTPAGTRVELVLESPAHAALSQSVLALTTVGANTAELGALAVPMLVLLPTQHLEVMQAWDGLAGLVGRLPGLHRLLGLALTLWRLRHRGFLASPNIAAGRLVVPERVGVITPQQIAEESAAWLAAPQRLAAMQQDLRSLRGRPGAVAAMGDMIGELLSGPPASS